MMTELSTMNNNGNDITIGTTTHVWVRTELVEALQKHNGNLPAGWKLPSSRKRARTVSGLGIHGNNHHQQQHQQQLRLDRAEVQEAWGWLRARMSGVTANKEYGSPPPSPARRSNSLARSPRMSPGSPYNNRRHDKIKKLQNSRRAHRNGVGGGGDNNSNGSDEAAVNTKKSSRPCTITVDDDEFCPPQLQQVTVTVPSELTVDPQLFCMANTWWQLPDAAPPDDLTMLTHLHEPSVVYCLQRRYEQNAIYTYTGKILIALNPFCSIPRIYDESVMHQYFVRGSSMGMELPPLPPHVYAVAQDAYGSMIRYLQEEQHKKPQQQQRNMTTTLGKENQSILVSGESGAGKTMTTKIIMRYLATLSKQQSQPPQQPTTRNNQGKGIKGEEASIESQVLQSNPILESFGNARTIRNDNSSRFGKFIEIQFLPSGCLVSAAITTYLLEKVRLITQAPGERNYHVFYELLAGVSHQERRSMWLNNATPSSFRITATSGTFDRRDGVDDRENYRLLRVAMETVGFSKLEQNDLLSVACGLLHASNLTFRETKSDLVELDPSNTSLQPTLALLGVTNGALNNALCLCAIEAAGETVHKRLSVVQSNKALEALIKATYGALFDHIVQRINNSIAMKQQREVSLPVYGTGIRRASIGVLDIFGFETFETNSYEQLCINYCNEALQQQFNRFVFKLEQEEYAREGIEWSFIAFPDNQDVLDLVEAKHSGILSILDEQCRLQRCTDTTFARAVYEKCQNHPRFTATHTQKVNSKFSIHHYAGQVEYDTCNFLEKNKDELPKETTELLMTSSHTLLSHLGKSLKDTPNRSKSPMAQREEGSSKKLFHRASSSILRDSVGSQFSSQLRELRARIEFTTPHYIRCIKPNDDLVPRNFNPLIIADQLRCAGVLEAVRVSRIGFPQRYPHVSFIERYSILAINILKQYRRNGKGRALCEVLVNSIVPRVLEVINDDCMQDFGSVYEARGQGSTFLGIQIGLSKVFLRQTAFDALEILRRRKLDRAAIVMQTNARRFIAQRHLARSLVAVTVIQNFVRKVRAITRARTMRQHNAATVIEAFWRRIKAEKYFVAALVIAMWCQSNQRRWIAKQLSEILKLEREVILIQRTWRKQREVVFFKRIRSAAVRLQCAFRVFSATRQLRNLRQEARDLRVVAAERDLFRSEAIRLRNELASLRNASRAESSPVSSASMDVNEVFRLQNEVERLKEELAHFQSLSSPTVFSPVSSSEVRFSKAVENGIPNAMVGTYEVMPATPFASSSIAHQILPKVAPHAHDSTNEHRQVSTEHDSPGKVSGVNSPSKLSALSSLFGFSFGKASQFSPFKGYSSGNNASPSRPISTKSLLDSEDNDAEATLLAMTVSPINEASVSLNHGKRNFGFNGHYQPLKRDDYNEPDFRAQFYALCHSILRHSTYDVEEVLRCSEKSHVLVNECDERGRTPLHYVAQTGNIKIAKLLLDHGAIVNSQDDDGETPLHLAEAATMMMFLLEEGSGANANIPNADGVCLLHLAVQRRDIEAVRGLLRHSANVNCADNIRWFTPLHLIALPAGNGAGDDIPEDSEDARDVRIRIAQLLCGATNSMDADLNYQDNEGNTPLHYAVQITSEEARDIVDVFLEKGADPKITNNRGQSPLHLLLHNEALRKLDMAQQILHLLLFHGADPNQQSMTGCTGLHLALYHRDIDGAVQLLNAGAQLHMVWTKPRHWVSFWNDHGMAEVLALDMVQDETSLHRLFAAITKQQQWAPPRQWCMHCKIPFGPFVRTLHCRHCGRQVCGSCTRRTLSSECFPKSFEVYDVSWVCVVCDKILVARKEDDSNGTQPTFMEDEEDDRTFF